MFMPGIETLFRDIDKAAAAFAKQTKPSTEDEEVMDSPESDAVSGFIDDVVVVEEGSIDLIGDVKCLPKDVILTVRKCAKDHVFVALHDHPRDPNGDLRCPHCMVHTITQLRKQKRNAMDAPLQPSDPSQQLGHTIPTSGEPQPAINPNDTTILRGMYRSEGQ